MRKKIVFLFVSLILIFGVILSAASSTSSAPQRIRKGDVLGDGSITAAGARKALRYASRLDVIPGGPDGPVFWAADVDNDGAITGADARIILRASSGLDRIAEEYYCDIIALTTAKIETIPFPTNPPAESSSSSPSGGKPTPNYPPDDAQFPLPPVPEYEKKPGTFVFITYGYGHGVGMSQRGAIYLGEQGCDYKSILGYYYRGGVGIATHKPPETVLLNGSPVDTAQMLARVTQQEIGGYIKENTNNEALKAQVVAAYTNMVEAGYRVKNLAYTSSGTKLREDIIQAVDDVYGEYLVYNGKVISAVFGAMSAGYTANPYNVWGGNYSYLQPVPSGFDRLSPKYIDYKIFTADQVRSVIKAYDSNITLQSNPKDWFKVLGHDGAVSEKIGYITDLQIGDRVINQRAGQILREHIFKYSIRSHCVVIEYYE